MLIACIVWLLTSDTLTACCCRLSVWPSRVTITLWGASCVGSRVRMQAVVQVPSAVAVVHEAEALVERPRSRVVLVRVELHAPAAALAGAGDRTLHERAAQSRAPRLVDHVEVLEQA